MDWLWIGALVAGVASLLAFAFEKQALAVGFLALGAFLLRMAFAESADFLFQWDERFHALAAQHLADHPLTPTLYENPAVYELEDEWTYRHIWLHKPPLALWQMALSIRLFGSEEWAVRLPSALLGAALVPAIARVGSLLHSREAGFIAALAWAVSRFSLNLGLGSEGMDHVDLAMTVYVGLSLWAWVEFWKTEDRQLLWAIIVGGFAGLAILTKYLTGLLPYAGWGLLLLRDLVQKKSTRQNRWRDWKWLVISLGAAFLVAAPWTIYTTRRFPHEAKVVREFYAKHLWEVLEGHEGTLLFHIERLPILFGSIGSLLIIWGGVYLLHRTKADRKGNEIVSALAANTLIVFLFFGLAATKVTSHVFLVALPVYVAIGAAGAGLLHSFKERFSLKRTFYHLMLYTNMLLAVIVSLFELPTRITNWQKEPKGSYIDRIKTRKAIFQRWAKTLPPNAVVFNVPKYVFIDAMYYAPNVTAYPYIPDSARWAQAVKSGRPLFVAKPHKGHPAYVYQTKGIVYLNDSILGD